MALPRMEQCIVAILNKLEADSESGALTPPILCYQRFPERGARYPLVLVEPIDEIGDAAAIQDFTGHLRIVLHINMANIQEIPTEATVLAHAVRKRLAYWDNHFGGCDLTFQRIEYSRWIHVDLITKEQTPITEVALLYTALYKEEI